MLVTHARKNGRPSSLARDYPSAPSRAGHRASPEFTNIQSIAQDAYFAGLFDGEGCVSSAIPNRPDSLKKARTVVCQIVMVEGVAVKALAARYGGTVLHRDMSRYNKNARPVFQWSVSGQIALQFMKAILPYASVKREQLEIAIRIQESITSNRSIMNRWSNHPDKPAILAERLQLAQRLSDLKRSPS